MSNIINDKSEKLVLISEADRFLRLRHSLAGSKPVGVLDILVVSFLRRHLGFT